MLKEKMEKEEKAEFITEIRKMVRESGLSAEELETIFYNSFQWMQEFKL